MRKAIASCLLGISVAGCKVRTEASQVKGVATQAGYFRGYSGINDIFRSRLLVHGSPAYDGFQISYFIGEDDPLGSGLALELGGFNGQNAASPLAQGVLPTGAGALTWRLLLTDAATRLAETGCDGRTTLDLTNVVLTSVPVKLSPAFTQAMTTVCAWPAASARTDVALSALWLAVMSYDAPQSEYQAFAQAWQQDPSPFAAAPAAGAVAGMLTTILLNPYYLLSD